VSCFKFSRHVIKLERTKLATGAESFNMFKSTGGNFIMKNFAL
jgi:hypothetical protein